MNNFFKISFLIIFLSFLALYYSANSGLIDYQARSKNILTEEQIKLFEEDVKNNVEIDLKKYLDNKEEEYNNNISKATLKVSNGIGNTIEKVLDFIFNKLENVMN